MLFKKRIEEPKAFEYTVDVNAGKEQREQIDRLYNSSYKICLELLFYLDDYKTEKIITESVSNISKCFYSCDKILSKKIYGSNYIVTYKTVEKKTNTNYLDHEGLFQSLHDAKAYFNGQKVKDIYFNGQKVNLNYNTQSSFLTIHNNAGVSTYSSRNRIAYFKSELRYASLVDMIDHEHRENGGNFGDVEVEDEHGNYTYYIRNKYGGLEKIYEEKII